MAKDEKIENGKSDEELEKEIMESAEAKNEEEVKDDTENMEEAKKSDDKKAKAEKHEEEYEDEDEEEDTDESKKSKKEEFPHKDEDEEDEEETDEDKKAKTKKEDIEVDVSADVSALVDGEELSEEFKAKAATIFEAAVTSKVTEVQEAMAAEYEATLTEHLESVKSELVERVDAYLEYVSEEWVNENKIEVEHGLKTEMTESFLTGMRGLFEDHYVTIPEEKYDVIHSMVEKLDEMEDKLNEQINKNVALNKRLSESVADVILADVSEGLALSQKEKLASLAENVEFESESNYREKLATLRDSYFSANPSAQRNHSENISEGAEGGHQPEVSGLMESYLQTLNRVSKK